MLVGLDAWTAHLEYQELLSGPLLVKLCIEVKCCFYLESRIRLKPFTIQLPSAWSTVPQRILPAGAELVTLLGSALPQGDAWL
jgi:hypothetical protein